MHTTVDNLARWTRLELSPRDAAVLTQMTEEAMSDVMRMGDRPRDVIDWQDIRLVCGEGHLTAIDVYTAVNIILRQRGITRGGEGTEAVPFKIKI